MICWEASFLLPHVQRDIITYEGVSLAQRTLMSDIIGDDRPGQLVVCRRTTASTAPGGVSLN